MPIYQSSFEINAPARRVWQILTALDRYPEWNPQIPRASGTIKEGATVNLRLTLSDRPPMDVSATIERAQPDALLTWRGHVVAPWLFSGYRKFEIEPLDNDHVRVTHVEDIRGLLAPIFSLVMGSATEKSQHALNEALRFRAEQSE